MREYLFWFLNEFQYPEEAGEAIVSAYDKILASGDAGKRFEQLIEDYKKGMNCGMEITEEKGLWAGLDAQLSVTEEICENAGVNKYTGVLLLFICHSAQLKEYYKEAGISESIWHTSMCDLRYKTMECKNVHGIWGSFSQGWFIGFFILDRFGFGKLQFEIRKLGYTYEKGDILLTPETKVLNTHIPRTGTRLDRESMKESYRQAAAFFREYYHMDRIVFRCASWLIYPRNRELISPDSNLCAFMDLHDIVEVKEYPDYSQVWRLFDVNYDGDVDKLPQDTSLRRGYADWIRKGEKTGFGHGLYVYEG